MFKLAGHPDPVEPPAIGLVKFDGKGCYQSHHKHGLENTKKVLGAKLKLEKKENKKIEF